MNKILYGSMKFVNLFIYAVLLLFVFSACSTSSVTVRVLDPADITVPASIKKVAVANRSLPSKKSQVGNVIEGIITGEGLFVDREASGNCIRGVADVLVSSPRFDVVIPGGLDLRGTGTAKFPVPLAWPEVEKICKESNADALVTLETFDSNVSHRYAKEERKKKVDGVEKTYIVYIAAVDIGISAGWRIYDPKKKQIIDENVFLDRKGWDAEGASESEAKKKLPNKRASIKDAGFFAGQQYGFRISPVWVRVGRKYYIKGHDDFKDAKFYVRANEWEKAAEKWQKHAKSPDNKIAGRATYNLALASEINGDLETSLEWAKRSYTEFRNKSAREYVNIISRRIMAAEKLKEQMGE